MKEKDEQQKKQAYECYQEENSKSKPPTIFISIFGQEICACIGLSINLNQVKS